MSSKKLRAVKPKIRQLQLRLGHETVAVLKRVAAHFRHSRQGAIDLAIMRFSAEAPHQPAPRPFPVRFSPVISREASERIEALALELDLPVVEVVRRSIHQLAETELKSLD